MCNSLIYNILKPLDPFNNLQPVCKHRESSLASIKVKQKIVNQIAILWAASWTLIAWQ